MSIAKISRGESFVVSHLAFLIFYEKKFGKNDGDWFVIIIRQTDGKNVLLDFSKEMELNRIRG